MNDIKKKSAAQQYLSPVSVEHQQTAPTITGNDDDDGTTIECGNNTLQYIENISLKWEKIFFSYHRRSLPVYSTSMHITHIHNNSECNVQFVNCTQTTDRHTLSLSLSLSLFIHWRSQISYFIVYIRIRINKQLSERTTSSMLVNAKGKM